MYHRRPSSEVALVCAREISILVGVPLMSPRRHGTLCQPRWLPIHPSRRQAGHLFCPSSALTSCACDTSSRCSANWIRSLAKRQLLFSVPRGTRSDTTSTHHRLQPPRKRRKQDQTPPRSYDQPRFHRHGPIVRIGINQLLTAKAIPSISVTDSSYPDASASRSERLMSSMGPACRSKAINNIIGRTTEHTYCTLYVQQSQPVRAKRELQNGEASTT
ncbi:hypothetical protein VTK26DRAFT_4992 [Humicola hyalothermophila]